MMKSEIKERPILFSGEMVRAILEGRKTMTRRIAKRFNPPEFFADEVHQIAPGGFIGWSGKTLPDIEFTKSVYKMGDGIVCPYGRPGDRLWVRETWGVGTRPHPKYGCVDGIEYRADQHYLEDGDDLYINPIEDFEYEKFAGKGWRSPIFMPRAASRILLEITDVRVERLKEITAADCVCEGIEFESDVFTTHNKFRRLWQSINGPESWAQNPWVWVIEFKRIEP